MKNIKYYLIDIFNEYKSKYPELKIWLSDNAVSQSWGMGVLPAYSLEPYNCELLGYKPGRMLKKKDCSPAVNRHKYFMDINNNIIGEISYAKFSNLKKEWLVYRKFYFRQDNEIIGLIFGATLESKDDANLNHVILVKLDGAIITDSYFYSDDNRFSARRYLYKDNVITNIEERLWLGTYIEHYYNIETEPTLKITENTPKGLIQIYPSN